MRPIKIARIFILALTIWSVLFIVIGITIQVQAIRRRIEGETARIKQTMVAAITRAVAHSWAYGQPEAVEHFLNEIAAPSWLAAVCLVRPQSEEGPIVATWLQTRSVWKASRGLVWQKPYAPGLHRATVPGLPDLLIEFYFDEEEISLVTFWSIVQNFLYLVGFTVVSALIGYYVLHKYVSGSLKGMEKNLDEFGKNPTFRLPPYPIDEFDRVARAFNRLADRLSQSQADLDWLTKLNQEVYNLIDQPLLITEKTTLVSYNTAAADFFGLSRIDCGHPLANFNQQIHNLMSRIAASNRPQSLHERKVKLKATSNKLYDIHVTGIHGRTNFFVVQIIDVTEAERLEMAQRVQQQVETLSVMASGVVHDLNNILSGLTGTTSILKFLSETQPQVDSRIIQEKVGLLEACSSRAISLSQSLLHLSSRREFEYRPFDLAAAVESALQVVRATAGPRVHFVWNGSGSSVQVMGDQARTEQIVLNLLINSVHALGTMADRSVPEGTITIQIRTIVSQGILYAAYPESRRSACVRLRVIDDGVGIPQEIQKRVFEPFFTTKSRDTGSGLGLSLVRTGMFLQLGWLALFSEPGLGTCVDLYFVPKILNEPPEAVGQRLRVFFWNHRLPVSEDLLGAYEDENIELNLADEWSDAAAAEPFDAVLVDHHLVSDETRALESLWSASGRVFVAHPCPELVRQRFADVEVLPFPFFREDLEAVLKTGCP